MSIWLSPSSQQSDSQQTALTLALGPVLASVALTSLPMVVF